ncbi:GyrI-like domain-containing protein [Propionivibrio sp.]|uniref:GyrI-like domain-containing protein n=1 Tax=Propionivibrio sp. TaxID=2212460 RepID=UPI0039E6C3F2
MLEFTVVEFPETRLAGVTIETDMERAESDCTAVWQAFWPRIAAELVPRAVIPENVHAFGVSRMIDEQRFFYSAMLQVESIRDLPGDMREMRIPGGLYVRCAVPSLARLAEAYTALYEQWPSAQGEYELDYQGVCFERYPPDFTHEKPFEILAAVVRRG